jgi:short-subunit dehydrogenase
VLIVSRKAPDFSGAFFHHGCDLSKPQQVDSVLEKIDEFAPDQLIYCAGGGPFGSFRDASWRSHEWAFQVNFLTPAKLLHELAQKTFVKQFLLLGSAVAESQPDPMASSYCASKHALLGLQQTLAKEVFPMDVRLYSPGYTDTELLPKGSWPRQQKKRLWSAIEVAEDLLNWSHLPEARKGHRKLSLWADDAEE